MNPTLTWAAQAGTKLTVGYEYLRDTRVADRGITSVQGSRPKVDPSTFYGDPEQSEVEARVNIASAALEQAIGGAVLRNRTAIAQHRNGDELERVENLVSPRAGVVYKPIAPLSVYGSYSVSYLPSSGDQFDPARLFL